MNRRPLSALLPVFPWDTLADVTVLAKSHPDGIVDLSVGTPVDPVAPLIRDALAAAAEWILAVENLAQRTPGIVATVGFVEARPGATNVIAGEARATLDIRHASDRARTEARPRASHGRRA